MPSSVRICFVFLLLMPASHVIAEKASSSDSQKQIAEIYQEGIRLREEGQYAQAEQVVQDGLKKFPDNVHLLTVLGDIQNFSGNYTGSIATYKKALEQSPRSASLLSALCSAEINLGEFRSAITHCEKALTLTNSDGTLWFNLGKSYAVVGDYVKGRKFYKKYVDEFERSKPNDSFVLKAKSEYERLGKIIQNRRSVGVPVKAPAPEGFSSEEKQQLAEIERRYVKLGMGKIEAAEMVANFRNIWATIPRSQRGPAIQQTLDGLPE